MCTQLVFPQLGLGFSPASVPISCVLMNLLAHHPCAGVFILAHQPYANERFGALDNEYAIEVTKAECGIKYNLQK